MPFEVNTGTSADPLDGTEKMPVSQGSAARVVTTNEFFYLNASTRMFTDRDVNIDNGTGGSLSFGDGTGLTITVTDSGGPVFGVAGGGYFAVNANDGAILNAGGSISHFSWAASGLTGSFAPSTGLRIWDADGSHTLRFAVGSDLSANRTFTLTTGNANRTLDISAGSVTISAAGAALIDDADASAQRATLGLGALATVTPGTGVATALAVNVGSAGAPVLFNGAGGTPSSLTLTNATGLPAAGLTPSTSTAVGFGSIELGHGTDTTISRASAGDIAVEGNTIYRAGGTDIPVTDGGTGRSTSTTAYGLIAAGTTATGAHQTLAAGATTEILVGGGASALPAWTTATGTGAPVRAGSPTLTGTLTAAAVNASGIVDVASSARVTGVSAPAAGAGMEMYFESDEGKILALNRTGGIYKNMNVIGLNVRLNVSGTNILVASSTGAAVTGLLSATSYLKTTAKTVATLTAAATAGAGARDFVTDANATTFASVVAGGGANGVPVYSDGTNWRIG